MKSDCCRPAPAAAPTPEDEAIAAVAKALAHPARVALLRHLLKEGECLCGELVDTLPLSQATVSQHVKVLKEAGLVQGEADGPRVCYCAEPRALETFLKALSKL